MGTDFSEILLLASQDNDYMMDDKTTIEELKQKIPDFCKAEIRSSNKSKEK